MSTSPQATSPDFHKLKVAGLKGLLKEKGLSSTGNKSELIERLKQAEEGPVSGIAVSSEEDLGDKEELDEDILNDDLEDDVKELVEEEDTNKENAAEKEEEIVEIKEKEETKPEDGAKKKFTPITITTEPKPVPVQITSTVEDDKVADEKSLTDEERLAQRAEKFGAQSPELKKIQRAERFGIVSSPTSESKPTATGGGSAKITPTKVTTEDLDKMKKRAERFGTVTSSALGKVEGDGKLKKRAERFGVITSTTLSKLDKDERIQKRKERFSGDGTTPEVEAKKSKRAERFGIQT